jgi:hypothetical protein
MAKKKPTDRHKKTLVPLRVTPEMREVLQRYADRERRSLAQATALLVEEILTQKRLWPPPGPGTGPTGS